MKTPLSTRWRDIACVCALLPFSTGSASAQVKHLECDFSPDLGQRTEAEARVIPRTLTVDFARSSVAFADRIVPATITEAEIRFARGNVQYALNRFTGSIVFFIPEGLKAWEEKEQRLVSDYVARGMPLADAQERVTRAQRPFVNKEHRAKCRILEKQVF